MPYGVAASARSNAQFSVVVRVLGVDGTCTLLNNEVLYVQLHSNDAHIDRVGSTNVVHLKFYDCMEVTEDAFFDE